MWTGQEISPRRLWKSRAGRIGYGKSEESENRAPGGSDRKFTFSQLHRKFGKGDVPSGGTDRSPPLSDWTGDAHSSSICDCAPRECNYLQDWPLRLRSEVVTNFVTCLFDFDWFCARLLTECRRSVACRTDRCDTVRYGPLGVYRSPSNTRTQHFSTQLVHQSVPPKRCSDTHLRKSHEKHTFTRSRRTHVELSETWIS